MKLVRMQTYQDPETIASLRLYAQEKGISVAAAIRQAVAEFKEKPAVKRTRDPQDLLDMIGSIKGTSPDTSQNIDEIYLED